MTSAQHMQETDRHGTPPIFIDIAVRTFGSHPDFDPCSEDGFNNWVKAGRYLTRETDATKTPWFIGSERPVSARLGQWAPKSHSPESVLCNPPSGLVKEFWYSLCSYWELGWISSAIWVGFSLEQLGYLQSTRATLHPLNCATLFPIKRVSYRTASGEVAGSPPHGSYLTLLTNNRDARNRFFSSADKLGHLINR